MSQAPVNKPLPNPSPEARRFWEGCKKHELWLPYCHPCRAFYWYPRDFCPRCASRDIEWRKASGRGTVYTFAIQYRAWHPAWNEDVPYVTALIDLEEGPRIYTRLVNIEPDPKVLACGMAVEAVFRDESEEISLPMFQPAAQSS
jgi:uncharacterized protein